MEMTAFADIAKTCGDRAIMMLGAAPAGPRFQDVPGNVNNKGLAPNNGLLGPNNGGFAFPPAAIGFGAGNTGGFGGANAERGGFGGTGGWNINVGGNRGGRGSGHDGWFNNRGNEHNRGGRGNGR